MQGPVLEIVTDPEYLDVSLPVGKAFTHSVEPGHTVFAYVIEGEGYFDQSRDSFAREAAGVNYFDMSQQCTCETGTLVLYGLGNSITVTTEQQPVHFLLISGMSACFTSRNGGLISPGDVQWMTAGNGIIHQEMPMGDRKGKMGGFQLWANLPASHKMMDPRYREVKQADIPVVQTPEGAVVRVICGEVAGVQGPVLEIVTDPEYLDVSLPVGKAFTHSVEPGHTVFAYVIEGEGYFDQSRDSFAREAAGVNYFDMSQQCTCETGTLVLYGLGNSITVTTEQQPVHFLLISGRPLGKPVAWRGPIVMNTQEELRDTFKEYQDGTFLRHARS